MGSSSFQVTSWQESTYAELDGGFGLQNAGEFDAMVARRTWSVVDGSATGGLDGIAGAGGLEAGQDAFYTLEYEH